MATLFINIHSLNNLATTPQRRIQLLFAITVKLITCAWDSKCELWVMELYAIFMSSRCRALPYSKCSAHLVYRKIV